MVSRTRDHNTVTAGGAPAQAVLSGAGPELAFELLLGFVQRATVGAGRQVLPAAVRHDHRDVGPLPRVGGLGAHRLRGVQRAASRDPGEDALGVQQCPGRAQRVGRRDREPRGQHGLVVELRHETLIDVPQAVDELPVPGLRGDDLHSGHVLAQEAAGPHQRARGPQAGHEVRDLRQVGEQLGAGGLVVGAGVRLVAVLVQHDPVRVVRGEPLRHPDGLVGAPGRG